MVTVLKAVFLCNLNLPLLLYRHYFANIYTLFCSSNSELLFKTLREQEHLLILHLEFGIKSSFNFLFL